MVTKPEDVVAPADDTTVFRTSKSRIFTSTLLSFVAASGVVGPLLSWLLDDDDSWWGVPLQGLLTGTVFALAFTFGSDGWRPTWIRTSAGGLELMTAGSDPIHLQWASVAQARIRRRLLRRVLEVTPVDMSCVQQVQDGNGKPPIRDRAFAADLTWVAPGPRKLRDELNRRLAHPRSTA